MIFLNQNKFMYISYIKYTPKEKKCNFLRSSFQYNNNNNNRKEEQLEIPNHVKKSIFYNILSLFIVIFSFLISITTLSILYFHRSNILLKDIQSAKDLISTKFKFKQHLISNKDKQLEFDSNYNRNISIAKLQKQRDTINKLLNTLSIIQCDCKNIDNKKLPKLLDHYLKGKKQPLEKYFAHIIPDIKFNNGGSSDEDIEINNILKIVGETPDNLQPRGNSDFKPIELQIINFFQLLNNNFEQLLEKNNQKALCNILFMFFAIFKTKKDTIDVCPKLNPSNDVLTMFNNLFTSTHEWDRSDFVFTEAETSDFLFTDRSGASIYVNNKLRRLNLPINIFLLLINIPKFIYGQEFILKIFNKIKNSDTNFDINSIFKSDVNNTDYNTFCHFIGNLCCIGDLMNRYKINDTFNKLNLIDIINKLIFPDNIQNKVLFNVFIIVLYKNINDQESKDYEFFFNYIKENKTKDPLLKTLYVILTEIFDDFTEICSYYSNNINNL